MAKVLYYFVHPQFEKSKVNRLLLEAIPTNDTLVFRDLYELYPKFRINIKAEQKLVLEAETIVWHHPLYWYSCPPLMKLWIDQVLELGWAYGPGGDKLQGKKWLQVISTGGKEEAYTRDGYHGFTMKEFLLPFYRTATLCGMEFLDPFLTQGSFQQTESSLIPIKKSLTNRILECLGE